MPNAQAESAKLLPFTFLILITLLLLTACAGAPIETPAAPTPTPTTQPTGRGAGDTLRLFYRQSPTTLNPHLTTSLKDVDAARITYEPLASFDRDGNLVPFLAAEIPSLENGGVAEDGMSVTWKLKEGVQWSDGEPFTAGDARFTFEYITNPEVSAASASTYEVVKDVEAVDDYTVKVHFKEPNPAWPLVFVGVQGMILPRHIFEPYNGPNADQAPANEMPIGTGPYRVVKFQPEGVLFLGSDLIETRRIVYEPNPHFREEDKPWFSRVELKGGSDNTEAIYAVLQSNEADFAWNLILQDAEQIEQLEALGYGKVIANPGSRVERILLNRSDPNQATDDGEQSSIEFPNPFLSDKRVRQAINYAVDRDAIAQLSGLAFPTSNNLVSPAIYDSPNTSYEYNPEKAAALLDEAGWIDSDNDGIRDKDGQEM
ncbi:MAG: peptide ABC transporter substrate-binding protein, partial [Anaerolineaceae bacterium 4572_5.1]